MLGNLVDTELVGLVAQGNHRAFHELFNRYYHTLCSFAYRICEDSREAEDVVQNFFLEFWNRRASLSIRYTFKAYAFRAVHNKALNQRERGHMRHLERITDELESIPDSSPSLDELNNVEAKFDRLEQAIDDLPEKCRQVFCLIYFEGMSYAQAATRLGISLNTVKVQMSRAYKRIRKKVII